MQDYKITRLHDCTIARLHDCTTQQAKRLNNYTSEALSDWRQPGRVSTPQQAKRFNKSTTPHMLLEICASSHQSALNAQRAGAHRIELCTELGLGGITPSYGLLHRVMADLSIPVNVLIRPRSGDFTYTDQELVVMKEDIKICKELGAAGIVTGILNSNLTIDLEKTKELIELARPLSFTFHRAFDWTTAPFAALENLLEIGVDRILSSGQQANAYLGINLLEALQKEANNRLEILPGGGINLKNINRFKELGFPAVHTSASQISEGSGVGILPMNTPKMLIDGIRIESDLKKIQKLLQAIKKK